MNKLIYQNLESRVAGKKDALQKVPTNDLPSLPVTRTPYIEEGSKSKKEV